MTRRLATRTVGVIAAALATVGVGADLSPDRRSTANDEFGFGVSFSANDAVCTAAAGGHAHGFVAVISQPSIDCSAIGAQPNIRTISVTAQYNAGFSRSPAEFLRGVCDPSKPSGILGEKIRRSSLGVAGRASAACGRTESDGMLGIYVVVQAGEWPGKEEETDPSFKTPLVNYICALVTVPAHFDEDLERFRSVLTTLHITR